MPIVLGKMEVQVDTLHRCAQSKEGNNQFKNKKQPENQTVWMSNNQGVEEETFIQTGVPRQRTMAQMKEQVKTPEKELSDEEIDNLSDAEFKTRTQDAHRNGCVWPQN